MRAINTHRPPSTSSNQRDRDRTSSLRTHVGVECDEWGGNEGGARSAQRARSARAQSTSSCHLISKSSMCSRSTLASDAALLPPQANGRGKYWFPLAETIHTVFTQESRFGRRPSVGDLQPGMFDKVAADAPHGDRSVRRPSRLFVPIVIGTPLRRGLVAGPFLVNEPTPSWIVRQWSALRGNAPE